MIKNDFKLLVQELPNLVKEIGIKNPFDKSDVNHSKFLELKNRGYCVIENYYLPQQCEKLRNIIDKLIIDYKDKIWIDNHHSDHRVIGANKLSTEISNFYKDTFIRKVVEAYEGVDIGSGFTLAARIDSISGNLGSGGGWHRDYARGKQTKAILYLNDTNIQNGPFQYIPYSHLSKKVLKKHFKFKLDLNQTRFSDELIHQIIEEEELEMVTLTGQMGSLILVDTRGLHRGMPIQEGNRYALTNYFFYGEDIPEKIKKQFITG